MFQEIRELEPRRIVFVELPFNDGTADTGPRQAWGKLGEYVEQNNLHDRVSMGIGTVMGNMATTPTDRIQYRACYVVNDDAPLPADPDGLVREGESEAGKFGVFLYQGPWAGMGEAWGRVFSQALPASGLMQRDAPIFEQYLDDASVTPQEKLRTEFFVPVE